MKLRRYWVPSAETQLLQKLVAIVAEREGQEHVDVDYGMDFCNDTFTLKPDHQDTFCTCTYDETLALVIAMNPHADGCWAHHAESLEHLPFAEQTPAAKRLADELGVELPEFGWSTHCTCGTRTVLKKVYDREHDTDNCALQQPNFHHYDSGLRIWWSDCISEGTMSNLDTHGTLARVFVDCVLSLYPAGTA